MRVLALASQKGGSGKTTLSGHLAVQAQRAGAGPVVLIDIDPQGSLADWWNEREAELPAFAQTTVARLIADLAVLRQQGFRLAVIDTPPAITMAIQSVISVAELIVVPTRPSPHDLRAVGATVDLCERAGKPLIFVLNGATPKAKITSEAAVALSQHGTVAPITLHHRTDFAASMIDGRTVMEVDPGGRSSLEVAALWNYISDRLEKNFRRTVFAAPSAVAVLPGAQRPQGASAAVSPGPDKGRGGMSEAKPIASLTPGLLARKGGARPAMRSQLQLPVAQQADDLGFNDHGEDPPFGLRRPAQHVAEVLPIKPAVQRQQEQLAARIAGGAKHSPSRRSALADGRSAAFTLRLDADRHLQLRLACTLANRSAQQLVTEALDHMLASLPEVADLAARAGKRR